VGVTRRDVIDGVTAYVKRAYGGTDEAAFRRAFDANDGDGDGRLSLSELVVVLGKSGVGWVITRPVVAKEIVDALDADGDGYVEWNEFAAEFRGPTPA
jgi:Ca2+-binding EF-hand superfamily protein